MKNILCGKIIALLLLFCSTIVCSQNILVDGLWYAVNKDNPATVSAIKVKDKKRAAFDIPSFITYKEKTYRVVKIEKELFWKNEFLQSVKIPNSVTSIGSCAFAVCGNLKEVILGDSVKYISSSAFSSCPNLEQIALPESVVEIMDNAFYDCSSLAHITIPSGVTTISFGAFSHCSKLKSVVVPGSVRSLGAHAFNNCTSLNNVVIEDGVTAIGAGAFQSCLSLRKITIGSSVKKIGDRAFLNCIAMAQVHISDLAAWCNIYFHNPVSNPMNSGAGLYLNGTLLTDLVVPKNVAELQNHSFYGCESLKSVSVGANVTKIAYGAFEKCTALEKIVVAPGNKVYDSRNNCNAIIETAKNVIVCDCKETLIPLGVRNENEAEKAERKRAEAIRRGHLDSGLEFLF